MTDEIQFVSNRPEIGAHSIASLWTLCQFYWMADWQEGALRTLNELEAFDAMRLFLEAFWERGNRQSEDIAVLLSSLSREVWANGMPGDPAQWPDWRRAVDETLGGPREQ